MGTYLELVLPEEQQTNEWVVDRYYDYVESKEREYFPEQPQEELRANYQRELKRENLEECGEVYLYEQITSGMIYGSELHLRDLFPSYYEPIEGDRTIYGEEIRQLISRLRKVKEQLKQEQGETHWEETFELQTIALCEFALENDYGIELG